MFNVGNAVLSVPQKKCRKALRSMNAGLFSFMVGRELAPADN